MEYKFIIERFEGEEAILKNEAGEQVRWPKNKLGKDRSEGDELVFFIAKTDKSSDTERGLAKDILNEILDA